MNNASERAYGAAVRGEWPLDPAVAYLNHGGYGATPSVVLAAQAAWQARIERNPTGFMTRELTAALRQAAGEVAHALGADAADFVFVENATAGINAVLRSLAFRPGDEIVITSLVYGAIRKAAAFVAQAHGARLVEVPITLPINGADTVTDAVTAALGPRTRLVIVDHIAASSALVLPVAGLIERVHRAGARILIDGAHAPGQVALEIAALGADWYVGNLHKWYFAPRGCGFLWAAKSAQAETHPLAISHGLGQGFDVEFDWTGTRDFTACLAAPSGVAFHQRLGGAALMARNAALAREAAALLVSAWGTGTTGPAECFAAMVSVRLPVTGEIGPARAQLLVRWLAERHRIETAITADSGALWLRISAQAYNEPAEYARLASAIPTAPQ
jgi:isopenicillin-N epimerase